MDVISLLTKEDSEGKALEQRTCAVGDNINSLLKGKKGHVSMYFIFTKKVTLTQPFKLLFYTKSRSLTHLTSTFALREGFPMWPNDKSAPRREKYPEDYIKLDFFQGKCDIDGKEGGIVYTWTDVNASSAREAIPETPRILRSPRKRNMGLFVTVPLEDSDMLVLSEKSYGSYIAMKARQQTIPMNTVMCGIMRGYCNRAMSIIDCGHCFCEICLTTFEDTKGPNDPKKNTCMFCSGEYNDVIRVKLRRGPCPIDLCVPDDATCGAVLLPCACRIQCERLGKVCEKYKDDMEVLIQKIGYCPYDACKKKVLSIRCVKDAKII